jgi:hypothetical protein
LREGSWKVLGAHSYALDLHKTPQKEVEPCNAALGAGVWRVLEEFRRPRPGSAWGGSRVHEGLICVLTRGGKMTRGHGRRSQAVAAAGAGAPASRRTGPGNKQQQDLLQCLGETPERLDGRENVRA